MAKKLSCRQNRKGWAQLFKMKLPRWKWIAWFQLHIVLFVRESGKISIKNCLHLCLVDNLVNKFNLFNLFKSMWGWIRVKCVCPRKHAIQAKYYLKSWTRIFPESFSDILIFWYFATRKHFRQHLVIYIKNTLMSKLKIASKQGDWKTFKKRAEGIPGAIPSGPEICTSNFFLLKTRLAAHVCMFAQLFIHRRFVCHQKLTESSVSRLQSNRITFRERFP